jgi:hypothetical protein
MTRLLQSFFAGMGSVLCIYGPSRNSSRRSASMSIEKSWQNVGEALRNVSYRHEQKKTSKNSDAIQKNEG